MLRVSVLCVMGVMGLGCAAQTPGTSQTTEPAPEAPAAESPPSTQAGDQLLGCYRDSNDPFDLDGYLERSDENTPRRCIAICREKGFAYAGVQFGESCLCGDQYGAQGVAENCDMKCTGDPDQICGGSYANSVYSTR